MAHYDVYRYDENTVFVQVQHDIVEFFETALVIPLSKTELLEAERLSRLNPCIMIHDESYILRTQEMTPIFKKGMGDPIANIANQHHAITAAIDFLFHGF